MKAETTHKKQPRYTNHPSRKLFRSGRPVGEVGTPVRSQTSLECGWRRGRSGCRRRPPGCLPAAVELPWHAGDGIRASVPPRATGVRWGSPEPATEVPCGFTGHPATRMAWSWKSLELLRRERNGSTLSLFLYRTGRTSEQ